MCGALTALFHRIRTGGKLVYLKQKKPASVPVCPVSGQMLNGVSRGMPSLSWEQSARGMNCPTPRRRGGWDRTGALLGHAGRMVWWEHAVVFWGVGLYHMRGMGMLGNEGEEWSGVGEWIGRAAALGHGSPSVGPH